MDFKFISDITDEGKYALLMEASIDGKKYAIKIFKEEYRYCPYVLEMECLALSCPYIIKGRSLVYVDDKIGIVLDLAEGDGIWLTMNNIPLSSRAKLFREAIIAVDYLHKCHILHLDLKPGNFLIYRQKDNEEEENEMTMIDGGQASTKKTVRVAANETAVESLSMKVSDFSLSVRGEIKNGCLYKKYDLERTPDEYLCPEFNHTKYTDKHDIWSLAISLLYMSIDNDKYMDKFGNYLTEADAATNLDYLINECNDTIFIDLINHMLEKDPAKRYSMSDIFQHEFMKGAERIDTKYSNRLVETKNDLFRSWCEKNDVDNAIIELANVILSKNDELLEGLFSIDYEKVLKKMIKWSIALSLADEMINNYKDASAHFSVLFSPKHSDVFFDITYKAKLKFINRKYISVFEKGSDGLMFSFTLTNSLSLSGDLTCFH